MIALTILLAGASLGIIVFQSAVLAPLVFTQLKDGSRGPFLRALFPRFFLILATLGLAMALSSYLGDFNHGAVLGCVALVLALIAYAFIPGTNRARDAGTIRHGFRIVGGPCRRRSLLCVIMPAMPSPLELHDPLAPAARTRHPQGREGRLRPR